MAWPLVAMAAAGAIKGIAAKKGQSDAATNAWQQAEDQRKRRQKQFELSDIRTEHGAEGRKTIGDIFGKGFLSNFGVDPTTGKARNEQFGAMLADPWEYRNREKLMSLSPHLDPIAKPKGPGFGGYLGAGVGGAAEGAAGYIGAGGKIPGMGGGGGAGAPAPAPGGAPDFGGPALPTTPDASPFPDFSPAGPGTPFGGGGGFARPVRRITAPQIY